MSVFALDATRRGRDAHFHSDGARSSTLDLVLVPEEVEPRSSSSVVETSSRENSYAAGLARVDIPDRRDSDLDDLLDGRRHESDEDGNMR